jgi:hypothetical protein
VHMAAGSKLDVDSMATSARGAAQAPQNACSPCIRCPLPQYLSVTGACH